MGKEDFPEFEASWILERENLSKKKNQPNEQTNEIKKSPLGPNLLVGQDPLTFIKAEHCVLP